MHSAFPVSPLPQTEQTLFGLWGHGDVRTRMQPQHLGPEPLPLGKVTDFLVSLGHSSQRGDQRQAGMTQGSVRSRGCWGWLDKWASASSSLVYGS